MNETKVFTRSFINNLMKMNNGNQSANGQKKKETTNSACNSNSKKLSSRNESGLPPPNKIGSPQKSKKMTVGSAALQASGQSGPSSQRRIVNRKA